VLDPPSGGADAVGFERALAALVGKPVLWHVSDPQSGVLLDLGERVEKERPTENPKLTAEQRRYRGESSVFITCTWFLNVPSDQTQPARQGLDERSWWHKQLSLVVGATVTETTTTADLRQLQIRFDNRVRLVADLEDSSEYQDYTVRVGREYWSVSADGQLTHQDS